MSEYEQLTDEQLAVLNDSPSPRERILLAEIAYWKVCARAARLAYDTAAADVAEAEARLDALEARHAELVEACEAARVALLRPDEFAPEGESEELVQEAKRLIRHALRQEAADGDA